MIFWPKENGISCIYRYFHVFATGEYRKRGEGGRYFPISIGPEFESPEE
jgi:hypothetical protein